MRKLIRIAALESNVVEVSLNKERIAKIVHAMLNAYADTVGLPAVQTTEYDSAAKASTEAAVQLVLDNPEITGEALHQAWVEARQAEGWVYGETKDADAKTHPCLVSWDQLSKEHRIKDEFFISIVQSYAKVFGDLAPEWNVKETGTAE